MSFSNLESRIPNLPRPRGSTSIIASPIDLAHCRSPLLPRAHASSRDPLRISAAGQLTDHSNKPRGIECPLLDNHRCRRRFPSRETRAGGCRAGITPTHPQQHPPRQWVTARASPSISTEKVRTPCMLYPIALLSLSLWSWAIPCGALGDLLELEGGQAKLIDLFSKQ